jgi:maltose alpha-D-glucosyltransferase/alpha-amylase
MQWSSDRNAGFSRANPQRLILPVIIDPEYHFESLNVEAQQNNPNSLLWWTKRLIALRKRYRAFGWGSIEFLSPSNSRVLSFVREHAGERILVVANLSRYVQFVELDLSQYQGMIPIELFGRSTFPSIGNLPYLLTLSEHAFYWFALEAPVQDERTTLAALYAPPSLEYPSFAQLCGHAGVVALEELLPAFLLSRPWFPVARRVAHLKVIANVPIGSHPHETQLLLVRTEYSEGESEVYGLALSYIPDSDTANAPRSNAVLLQLATPSGSGAVVEALEDLEASRSLVDAIVRRIRTRAEQLELWATCNLERIPTSLESQELEPTACHSHTHVGSNATIQYGDELFLKVFRHLEEGMHPDLELSRFLTHHAPGLTPALIGSLELRSTRGRYSTVAVLQEFVPNEGSAWDLTRRELDRFYERALSQFKSLMPPQTPHTRIVKLASEPVPLEVSEALGAYQEAAALLGERTAQLHIALASGTTDPAFAPEAFSALDRRSQYQSFRNQVGRVTRTLRAQLPRLPEEAQNVARQVLSHERASLERFEPLLRTSDDGQRIRVHGDYTLRQVLWTGKDFVIVDFDGGKDRPLSDRLRKRSPLRDVAAMVLSFQYAARTALSESSVRESDMAAAEQWQHIWHRWVSAIFVRSYLATAKNAAFLPQDLDAIALQVDRFVLARAFRQLGVELVSPSTRIALPLHVIAQIMSAA